MCCQRGQTLCSEGPLTRLLYLKCSEREKAAVVYRNNTVNIYIGAWVCAKLESFKNQVCIWRILNRNPFFSYISYAGRHVSQFHPQVKMKSLP